MNETQVLLQPAYILQHRKYRESSLILDVLTRDYGIISILARGVRKKKSKTAGMLLAFTALRLSFVSKNELKLLTQVEIDQSALTLKGLPLYCGFYVNELVNYFLHKHDPHPEVFVEYQQCLTLLANNNNTEQVLRFFELNLIEHIGYGIQLTVDAGMDAPVQATRSYLFSGEQGMIESHFGYVTGETLLSLEARQSLDEQALIEAKKLMRQVVDFQLQGKELKSRRVLAKIIKQL